MISYASLPMNICLNIYIAITLLFPSHVYDILFRIVVYCYIVAYDDQFCNMYKIIFLLYKH